MIRQAISCDVCGSEKRQTNHWFVVSEQSGELRVSGWSSRNRLRPGSKHLCGQTCLHKLVDDFITRTQEVRVQPASGEDAEEPAQMQEIQVSTRGRAQEAAQVAGADTSLTSHAAYEDIESSARLIAPPAPPTPPAPVMPIRQPLRTPPELVPLPPRIEPRILEAPLDEPPRFASRNWHAEAWDRERARELRAVERRPDTASRRRSGS